MGSEISRCMTHLAILAVLSPLFPGLIAKTKAFLVGRKGPPLLQTYYDLFRLFKKDFVISRSASWVLRLAPIAILASLFTAGLLLPVGSAAPLHFEGDVILFVNLLAVVRFFSILGAMDVGSSFEGMGASREATFGVLSELSFFLGLIALSVMSGSVSLNQMLLGVKTGPLLSPALFLLFGTFFLNLLAENSRMPVDDPATHLELTMIHEVMILDYAGPDLGMILYGASIKLFLFLIVVVSILWPSGENISVVAPLLTIVKACFAAIAIGVLETAIARLRLIKIPQLLIANFVVTALALLVTLLAKGLLWIGS